MEKGSKTLRAKAIELIMPELQKEKTLTEGTIRQAVSRFIKANPDKVKKWISDNILDLVTVILKKEFREERKKQELLANEAKNRIT